MLVENNVTSRLHKSFSESLKGGIINDGILTPRQAEKIQTEWAKFIVGKKVAPGIVPPMIYASWQRSREYGVDPYSVVKTELSTAEIREQIINRDRLGKKYGDIVLELEKIANKKGLIIQLFDKRAKNIQVIAFSKYLHRELGIRNAIATDVSEKTCGTNAVVLALRENKAVQVWGPEHYNYYFHNSYCSAAPLHDNNGEIIGALNVYSYNHKHNIETLMLVTFLAKILDNIALISEALQELNTYQAAVHKTIEYLPQGVLFLNHEDEVKCYNRKIIDFLKIDPTQDVEAELAKFIDTLQALDLEDDRQTKAVAVNVKGKKSEFLLSMKKIFNDIKQQEEKLILLEKMQKDSAAEGNEAVYTFNDIIGNNVALTAAKQLGKKVAGVDSPVLIFGESGTGKELFAQAIHNAGPRRDKPFVAINCGAIPAELVESELFGYEPGAFTGAAKHGKKGKLELACGGTLFLDEVESMPVNVQIKLLRTLSVKKITKIGGLREIPIDIRLISATKKDLLEEADRGSFRDDLYYRISTIIIKLPPLRERLDDIPVLADYYLKQYARRLNRPEITADAEFITALNYYHWRGNVRELKNVIERAVVLLGEEQKLTFTHLTEKVAKAYTYKHLQNRLVLVKNRNSDNLIRTGEEIIIKLLLQEEKGNLSKVAERLGISRPTLYNKINNNAKLKKFLKKM